MLIFQGGFAAPNEIRVVYNRTVVALRWIALDCWFPYSYSVLFVIEGFLCCVGIATLFKVMALQAKVFGRWLVIVQLIVSFVLLLIEILKNESIGRDVLIPAFGGFGILGIIAFFVDRNRTRDSILKVFARALALIGMSRPLEIFAWNERLNEFPKCAQDRLSQSPDLVGSACNYAYAMSVEHSAQGVMASLEQLDRTPRIELRNAWLRLEARRCTLRMERLRRCPLLTPYYRRGSCGVCLLRMPEGISSGIPIARGITLFGCCR